MKNRDGTSIFLQVIDQPTLCSASFKLRFSCILITASQFYTTQFLAYLNVNLYILSPRGALYGRNLSY